jgi:hypothetical protein
MTGAALIANAERWHLAVWGPGGIRISAMESASNATAADIVLEIRSLLPQERKSAKPLLVAPPANWFVSAAIPTSDLPRRDRRSALLYRFEEFLPLAAEDIDADFVESGGRALCVGAIGERARPLVEALETASFQVVAVLPAAVLAVSNLAKHSTPDHIPDVYAFESGESTIELVSVRDLRCADWVSFSAGNRAVEMFFEQTAGSPERSLRIQASGPSALEACSHTGRVVKTCQESMVQSAAQAALAILSGSAPPPLDTRSTALAGAHRRRALHRPLQLLLASTAILLASLIATNLITGQRSRSLAWSLSERELEAFKSAFPNQPPPPNVRARLESSLKKAQSVREQQSSASARLSSLSMLGAVLEHLPADKRFRIDELRIVGPNIQLQGQATSHADAEAIVQSLSACRTDPVLTVDPAKTELLGDKAVSFVITASARQRTTTASAPQATVAGDHP